MSSLREYSKNIYASKEGSDFSIFVLDENGTKVEKKVHKYIIRRSEYFSAMLKMNGKEVKEGYVTIADISNDTMEYILNYLYTDELSDIKMEQAIEITSAADYLQLDQLKAASTDQWKKIVVKKTPGNAFVAFRGFAEAKLRVAIDETWREIMELILRGVYLDSYNFAKETHLFVEQVINYFGSTHPYSSMDLLAQWTLGSGLNMTKDTLKSRKQSMKEFIKRIDLQKLTLRTLTNLSKSEAYPSSYMLQQLQKKAESKDASVCGEVTYTILTKKNRIVELEHETGFVGAIEGLKANDRFFRHCRMSHNCESLVQIMSPENRDKALITWDPNIVSGALGEVWLQKKLADGDGVFRIKVTLKCKDETNDQKHQYTYDFSK